MENIDANSVASHKRARKSCPFRCSPLILPGWPLSIQIAFETDDWSARTTGSSASGQINAQKADPISPNSPSLMAKAIGLPSGDHAGGRPIVEELGVGIASSLFDSPLADSKAMPSHATVAAGFGISVGWPGGDTGAIANHFVASAGRTNSR